MNKAQPISPSNEAIYQYTIIAPLLDNSLTGAEKKHRMNDIMRHHRIAERTLYRWISKAKVYGPCGLNRKKRSDAGNSYAISPTVYDEAVKLRVEVPLRSTRAILEILEAFKVIEKGAVAESTLNQKLTNDGYSSAELIRKNKINDNTYNIEQVTRRFAKVDPNTLWQSDVMFGPYVPNDKGMSQQTFLITFLDDCTRLAAHSEFFFAHSVETLDTCFRKALLKYGVPDALYVDNGGEYVSKWLRNACFMLNVNLLHAKPYSPESTGKQERFHKTVRAFIAEIMAYPAKSLAELNTHYFTWLDAEYTHKPHSGLADKKTPLEAYNSNLEKVHFITPENTRLAFMHKETRRVDKVGTFKFQRVSYDCTLEFAKKEVTIYYDPYNLGSIEVWKDGKTVIANPQIITEFVAMKDNAVNSVSDNVSESATNKEAQETVESESALIKACSIKNKEQRQKKPDKPIIFKNEKKLNLRPELVDDSPPSVGVIDYREINDYE